MKNTLITSGIAIFTLAFTLSCSAQDTPQKIKDAFTGKYHNAENVEWEKNDDDDEEPGFEVEFKLDGQNLEAFYGKDGSWKYTKRGISVDELPAAVRTSLQDKHAGIKIKESDKVDTPEGTRYEVEADTQDAEKEFLLEEDGTIANETTDTEDDDDGWFS